MNILLISPNTLTVPYPVYPIGLDYVAGSIDKRHAVEIADLNVHSLEQLKLLVEDFAPQIIGVSCRNVDNIEIGDSQSFIGGYRELVSWLRTHSKAIIVCGGSGFTIMPEKMLSFLGADYGIIGEGERFSLLIEAIENGRDPESVPGVIGDRIFNDNGKVEPWQGRTVRGFKGAASHTPFYLERGGMLNLQSKRGCSFNCVYCSYPAIEGRAHRLTDPDEVAATALQLQNFGAKYLFLTDSAFNSDVAHSLAVGDSFRKSCLSIPWGGFFAPTRMPADYFARLAACGLKHVEFGTESLSDSMLRNYRKPFNVQDVFDAHRKAIDAGLHVAHYFMLGGPGESADTLSETLDNVAKLEKTALFFFSGVRIYPQTGLYRIAIEEKQISAETDLLEPVFYKPEHIDLETIESMVRARLGNRINCQIGSEGGKGAATVRKMHDRGFVGPLWEYLIR